MSHHHSDVINDASRSFGLIPDIIVHAVFGGKAAGSALSGHAEKNAGEIGVSEMMTGVLACNVQARSLYLAQGFEEFAVKLEKKCKIYSIQFSLGNISSIDEQ